MFAGGNYNQIHPRISGDKVVWKDSRVGNRYDLYIKDLAGGEEKLLATNTGSGEANIHGNYVTWYYKNVVYLLDLITMERIVVDDGGSVSKIYGNKIIYQKYHDDGFNYLHIYNIETKKEFVIDFKLKWISETSIYEDILVFTAPSPNGITETFMDIYLTYL